MLGRPAERAALPLSATSPFGFMFGTPDAEKVAPTWANAYEAFATNGTVFAVAQARLSLFTEAQFKFQRKADKSLWGDQSLRLLEDPWPNGTTGDLLARMIQDTDLLGNAYVRKVAPDRLERLEPQHVTIVSQVVIAANDTEVRECVGFLYDPPANSGRSPAYYPVEEVAHWAPMPDPAANFRGMSWLTPVLRDIDADTQMTDYKRSYLTNAATPNLIIKYAAELKADQRERLAEQVRARHGGVENAFRTMVLDAGADPMIVGNTFEAMAFQAVQGAGENRIAVAGGVPAIVAGLAEGLDSSAYGVYQFAMRRFTDITMRPLWRTACAALAKFVDVPEDSRLWFDVEDVAALRQGEKDSADTMQVLGAAAQSFITAGYTPDSITKALSASDVNLLRHSGLVSVQLQPPGSDAQPPPEPAPREDQ